MRPGDLFADRYRIEERLGEGGMGVVHRAVDERLGRQVALKIGRPGAAVRFAAEARALASLTHRSIVRLLGHGETSDRRPFLALEWVEGESVAGLLHSRGAGIPPRDALRLLLVPDDFVVAIGVGVSGSAARRTRYRIHRRNSGRVQPE